MNPTNETSPDELLDTFKGRRLKTTLLFTILIHAVVLLGTSVPFLLGKVVGTDTSELSEEERTKAAVKEANATLRRIAEDHGIKARDLSSAIAGGVPGSSPAEAEEDPEPVSEPDPDSEGNEEIDEPKSPIEEEIERVEEGPTEPPIPGDEEVDLFR